MLPLNPYGHSARSSKTFEMRTTTRGSAVIVNSEEFVGDVEQGPLQQRGIIWQRNHIASMSRSAGVAKSLEMGFPLYEEIDEKAVMI